MVPRGPIVLRAAVSCQRSEKQVMIRSLHIRGAIGLVSPGSRMA
jgi:hypothetical protein